MKELDRTLLMVVVLVAFVFVHVVDPPGANAQPAVSKATLSPCDLFDPGISEGAPITIRGQFKRAFSLARAHKYPESAKAFHKVMATFDKNIQKLFHPPDGKADNERIQRFLANHVYGKDPEFVITADDFRYVPIVYLTLAKVYCHTNDGPRAARTLEWIHDPQHMRLAAGKAAVELLQARPFEALRTLEPAKPDDEVRVRLLRTMAMHQAGQVDDARAELERAQTQCVGPVECGFVERLRGQLSLDKSP